MSLRRRRLLKSASVVVTGAIAGCSVASNDAPDTTDDPRATGTTGAPDYGPLRFHADIVEQASPDAPASAAFRIENAGSTDVVTRPGSHGAAPFEYLEPLAGDPGEFLLLPTSTSRVQLRRGEPTRRDGCWRIIDADDGTAYRSRISTSVPTAVPAGASHTVRHEVYYRGPTDGCPTPGEYRTDVTVEYGRDDGDGSVELPTQRELTCLLRVDSEGEHSLSLS
ncbi:hypothetical protein [Haloarchaeobius iranensis]|uniref:Uncharacterized protein n=1 Tax=Haloarchaeobius iranensis TaxID=996166 RepID=A0A1G9UYC9_9EURY|nr:hypothetical protein [Haloarchaeobius iranensis]SDM64991.1 hypothetical protein SAMN05192554_10582 [Haloarchaeobius iranensis]